MSEELVEKVARSLSVARCGLPDGAYSEADARVAIGVVLDAVRERVEGLQRYGSYMCDPGCDPESWGCHLDIDEVRKAISGLSIGSLGAEGGNPE